MSLTEKLSKSYMIRCPRSLSKERMQQTVKYYHQRCQNGSLKPGGSVHKLVAMTPAQGGSHIAGVKEKVRVTVQSCTLS